MSTPDTASPPVTPEETTKPKRVLVVDDEPFNLRLLSRLLVRDRYAVLTAPNGAEALRIIHDVPLDLVLLDISMPVMDGLAVCHQVRSDFRTRGLPIILVTARGNSSDRILGYRAGADDYIVKPYDVEELKARMEGALERRTWDLYRHPLTGLPGSHAIEEEVRRRIPLTTPWAFAYVDIDYFKAYNDIYGYDAGDQMIRALAQLLLEFSARDRSRSSFPGHVGGDDFVLIGELPTLREGLPLLLERFDALRETFYTPEDFAAGQLRTKDRLGREQEFPLVALSVAVVSTETRKITHHARLIEIASELKHYVKRQPHQGRSMLMWDRRRDTFVP